MKKLLLLFIAGSTLTVSSMAQTKTATPAPAATPVKMTATPAPATATKAAPVMAAKAAPQAVKAAPQPVATKAPVAPANAPKTPAPAPTAATAAPVAPAAAQTAPAADNPNAPDIKFVLDQHDFGTVPEGPQAKYDFDFTNEGKEPLILQNVQASCGCTTPEWPKTPILPGQKAKVTAIYNTQGRPGPFTKTITVTSNAKTPSKVITIRGTVEAAPATTAPEKAPNMISTPAPEKH